MSSNYIWRGVTQTNDSAAISAALERHVQHGGYLGVWASNINYEDRPSYEVNLYLGQKFELSQANLDLSIRHYYFPSGGKYSYDFQPLKWENHESSAYSELQLGVTRGGWEAAYAYSNSYLSSGKPGYYIELNYSILFTNELSVKFHLGSQKSEAIDDIPEHRVGDRNVTLAWRNIFITASNMTDNLDGRQSDRVRYILGWRTVIND